MGTKALFQLNTGLTWKRIDIRDVVTFIAPYAKTSFDEDWPSRAFRCGNLIQLDFRVDILEKPGGNAFLQVNEPYKPIDQVYIGLNTGGILINSSGSCGGWIDPGAYFIHVVYAINLQ